MNEAVYRWEMRSIVKDNCPLCLTHFATELIELYNVVYSREDPLPRESFYRLICPAPECLFEEYLVVMRSKYLTGLNPVHESMQAVALFLEDHELQCETCGGILGKLFSSMEDASHQRFQLQAYCQACEEINHIQIGWKVINLPVGFDPALRARKALRLIDTVPQLLATMNHRE